MLYALGDPLVFVLLLLWTLLAITLHGWLTSLVLARGGVRAAAGQGRSRPDPRRQVDPFGAIAAATGGVGWSAGFEGLDRRRRGLIVASAMLPALVLIALGTGLLVGFSTLSSDAILARPSPAMQNGSASWGSFLAGGGFDPPAAEAVLLLGGLVLLYTGLLSLLPLPPLAGGRLLFALAPQSIGWQKAEHQLVERNIGVAVLVGISLLLAPLLYAVLDAFAAPWARVVTGG